MTQYGHWIYTHATLGFLDPLHCLWAPLSHFFPLWASLAHLLSLGILCPFSNSAFSWAFTNSFGLPWPSYLILHPWGSWTFHQPLTFLLHYLWLVVAHSYFSISHNAHGFTTSLSELLWAHFLFLRPIYLLYGPMIHFSCHSGLMVLLSIY